MRGETVEEPRIDFDDAGGASPVAEPIARRTWRTGPSSSSRRQNHARRRPTATPSCWRGDDELLTPIARELVRHCKRVLQNEQNEILDALRRRRGRPTPEKLLPPLSQQVTAWSEVLTPAIVEAYVAARTAAEPDGDPVSDAPQRMVTGMVEVLVTPLRDRLLAAVDETLGDDANPDVIAHRIGRATANGRERSSTTASAICSPPCTRRRLRRRAGRSTPAVGSGRAGPVPRRRRQRARAHTARGSASRRVSLSRPRIPVVGACSQPSTNRAAPVSA